MGGGKRYHQRDFPNTFEPDAPVTRAQVMTFLYRNADSPSTRDSASFADVPTDAYYGMLFAGQ